MIRSLCHTLAAHLTFALDPLLRCWLPMVIGVLSLGMSGCSDRGHGEAGQISLREVAREFGMRLRVDAEAGAVRLEGRGMTLAWERGERRVRVNGILVYHGEPLVQEGRRFWLDERDVERVLRPLVQPQRVEHSGPVRRIILDPGHGAGDSGAQTPALGLKEKERNLTFAKILRRQLEAAGYAVALTRETDELIPLLERPRMAAELGGDLFLSLHFNGTQNPEVRGAENFVLTHVGMRSTPQAEARETDALTHPGNAFDGPSLLLAYQLQRAMVEELGLLDRGVKQARFVVLREAQMPSVLLEPGFMTHPEEALLIADDAFLERLAVAVVGAVRAYEQLLSGQQKAR